MNKSFLVREKAEVLIDVERLTRVQAELTAEVQSLHAQLEQEKSKKHYSNDKDHKAKDKVRDQLYLVFNIFAEFILCKYLMFYHWLFFVLLFFFVSYIFYSFG